MKVGSAETGERYTHDPFLILMESDSKPPPLFAYWDLRARRQLGHLTPITLG